MLRELVALEPGKAILREYEDSHAGEGQLKVKVDFGAPKHGTELHMHTDARDNKTDVFDEEYNLFLPQEKGKAEPFFLKIGNMWVGQIVEVGAGVSNFKEGQKVAGYGGLKNTQIVKAERVLRMNDTMTWKEAVCYDPAHFALGGVRDARVRLGDKVAVFGLGAIGLMAAQMAKLSGAAQVIVVDPIEARRKAALQNGADLAIDPTACDAGLEIKKATGKKGVDSAIETSASYVALHQAIRGLAFGGIIAVVGWYKECKGGLNLGLEAHFNQPNILISRACDTNRDHPRWDWGRVTGHCWEMLSQGLFQCENIVNPVVSFDQAAETFNEIGLHPEKSVKMGVDFTR